MAGSRRPVERRLTITEARSMTESHEDRSLSPAPGVPRRGAPAQLQQRGTRARRLAVRGELLGAAAGGSPARGAAHPHDAQRVADGCGKAPPGDGRPWARPGAGCPRQRGGPARGGGGSASALGPTDGGGLRHQPGAAHLSRTPPARGGGGRHRGPLRGGGRPQLSRAPRHAREAPGPLAPRVHHLPRADDGDALRLGAGAGPQDVARAGARGRGHQRQPGDAVPGRVRPRAHVRLRAGGAGAATHRTVEGGARGLRAHRSRVLPVLPEPRAALPTAPSLHRGGEGAGGESTLNNRGDARSSWSQRCAVEVSAPTRLDLAARPPYSSEQLSTRRACVPGPTPGRRFKDAIYQQFARVSKALASPHRIELVDLLAQGPRTVDVLARLSDMSLANTSQHLQVLRAAGLVEANKEGLFVTTSPA